MKFISVGELSAYGKAVIGFILGLGGLLQIPAVSAPVAQFVHYHPHYAFIIATITGLSTLLVNPQVDKLIGYTPTQTISTTVPPPAVAAPAEPVAGPNA